MMDAILDQLIEKLNERVSALIDVAEMPPADKAELKEHLRQAEAILLKNGQERLHQVLGGITGAILGRL